MEGDLVLRVGDKPIFNQNDLMREIGLTKPGTVVRIKIFRRTPSQDLGREMDVSVEVGKWPVLDEEGIIATNPIRGDWQGIVYDYSTARKRCPGPPCGCRRARVMESQPGTEAASLGFFRASSSRMSGQSGPLAA
jgi:hypothetical protein